LRELQPFDYTEFSHTPPLTRVPATATAEQT